MQVTAQVKPGDGHQDFAEVTVTADNGQEITFVIHASRVHSGTVNVEIDHDWETEAAPRLRINYNDTLVADSDNAEWMKAPALDDDEPGDLDECERCGYDRTGVAPTTGLCPECQAHNDGRVAL